MALFARSSRLLFAPRMPVVVASRAIMTSRVAYSEPPKKKAAAAAAAAAPAAPKQAAPAAEVPLDSQFAFRGIPGRYARILLEFARKHGQDKTVREDLNSLNQAIQDNYSLRSMFHRVPLDSLGASDITKILLEELRSKGHVHHFGAIAKTYEAASRVVNNEQHLTLVTTRPLTTAENANVLKLLKTDYAPTSEIVLTNDVDPSIVGGFVIHTDDMVCDLSLKTLLSRWYSDQEEEIQLEHEKRLSAIQQSIRTPEIPRNTAFMERVQAGVAHLEKQTGMSELQH